MTGLWRSSSNQLGLVGDKLNLVIGTPKTGDIFAGTIAATDLGKLVTAPTSVLAHVASFSSLSVGLGPTQLVNDPHAIWWGSPNITGSSVQVMRLDPASGALQSPRYDVHDVSQEAGVTVTGALAAPFSNTFSVMGLVAWVEDDGAGNSQVYGQLVSCSF